MSPASQAQRTESRRVGNAAKGLITFFTQHRTAHNLLMSLMILAGLYSFANLRLQFFPDIEISRVDVTISYPGATATQVDEGVIAPLEPQLRQIEDIVRVRTTARPGFANLSLEFEIGADIDAKLDEAQRLVSTFALPTGAEEPSLSKFELEETVTHFVLTGPVRHDALITYAEDLAAQIEDAVPAKVRLFGAPLIERQVELYEDSLEAVGLNAQKVAATVTNSVRSVAVGEPAGTNLTLETGKIPRTAKEIEDIILKTWADGTDLKLGQVGSATFAPNLDTASLLYIGNRPAVDLDILRSASGDSLEIRAVSNALMEEFKSTLPSNIEIIEWGNSAELISSRISLLIKNGAYGMLIVLILLFLFMGARSAFWVAAGIPVAILGTLAVMLGLGQTINMISLFAILLSLGIIVDDAIVVAEHSDALHRQGLNPQEAAMRGGLRMSGPVLASSLTTIAAFAPLFLISGEFGAFVIALPLVVIAVIVASLIECFLILPGHMKSALSARERDRAEVRWWNIPFWIRDKFDAGFHVFGAKVFVPLVRRALFYRYVTLVLGCSLMGAAFVLLQSGRIEQQLSPDVEFNNIFASFEMSSDAELTDTVKFCEELNRSLDEALVSLNARETLVIAACYTGVDFLDSFNESAGQSAQTFASLAIELADASERAYSIDKLLSTWRPLIFRPAKLDTLQIQEPAAGPGGQAIRLRLRGQDIDQLAIAADFLVAEVKSIDGTSEVSNSFSLGPQTYTFETNSFGRALGFSDQDLGSQMRAALTGTVAYRYLDQEDEVPVRLILEEQARSAGSQENLRVQSPSGVFTNVSDVTNIRISQGLRQVRRFDGQAVVRVNGDLDQNVTDLATFSALMANPELTSQLESLGASLSVGGEAEQLRQLFADLTTGGFIGVACIFIVLAWVFSSYTRPIVVMLVIPFGIVGAVFGHWFMDMPMAILSYISIFGLAGIVVNDSIVLVSRIDERANENGEKIDDAIVGAARDRLRAVLLTSLTTIGGLLPLMFETSVQAQFLIPMAVTIVFGLSVSTLLILIFVPALIGIQRDLGVLFGILGRFMFLRRARTVLALDPER